MTGGAVDSDWNCVIDWAFKLDETKRRGEGNRHTNWYLLPVVIFCALIWWWEGGKSNDLCVSSISFGLRSIRFSGILAPSNHWLAVILMVRTTLWWAETNHPGNKLSAKQIKTQNKAICFFFFPYKFQITNVHLDTYGIQALSWALWPSICVGSKGPRMICTPTWMRRKKINHYVSPYHFPCNYRGVIKW